ncbi:MAG TPA: DNA-binding protein [Candidatus Binatia bacterium]|nr:DNA-binding protein [Candidatus Binatia bacterium]
MRKEIVSAVVAGIVAFGLPAAGVSVAAAQPGAPGDCPHGACGMSGSGRMYDPKTVESVAGEVVKVERVAWEQGRGKGMGVHLVVKTDQGETIPVHLGPAWYVDKQDVKIAPNDHIQVKGSRITFHGKPVILAAEVKDGDRTLVLRNDAGIPAWSRGGGGGRGGRRGTAPPPTS